mmetsp:Transcript_60135/g.140107  ORF Transcript_60135/g.140107 Transcript_60135/m.140107 type:complete len:298 (-) Transcript_60135:44-937(-)
MADDEPSVHPRHFEYFQSAHWDSELAAQRPEQWDAAALAKWVRLLAKRPAQKRREELLTQAASELEAQMIDGALLLAGGPTFLVDVLQPQMRKPSASQLKICANQVFAALKEEGDRARSGSSSYWELMAEEEQEVNLQCCISQELAAKLFDALSPQHASALRFVALLVAIDEMDVASCDARVPKFLGQSHEVFMVVSVSTYTSPDVVRTNMIYAKDTETLEWQNIASVDFAQHGDAPAGHWHLNVSAEGTDTVQHWGPRGQTFHGNPQKIPLWWLDIPEGKLYHVKPLRHCSKSWTW